MNALIQMLGIEGSKYFIKLWAGQLPIEDYRISPINGDLEGLGRLSILLVLRKRYTLTL